MDGGLDDRGGDLDIDFLPCLCGNIGYIADLKNPCSIRDKHPLYPYKCFIYRDFTGAGLFLGYTKTIEKQYRALGKGVRYAGKLNIGVAGHKNHGLALCWEK